MDQDDFQITVEVSDPKVKDGMQKYTTYSVRGMDRSGQFDVPRRYNDFHLVRSVLISKWPGCYIPPLPPKKALGNLDQEFIDDRMKHLEDFVKKIAQTKYLWYSEEFQIFIKQNGDIEKLLQQVPKITNDEIINKYQETFADLSGKEINTLVVQKIQEFNNFLKKVTPMVENFKQIAKNISDARLNHQKQIQVLLNNFFPQYEQNIIQEYTDQKEKLIITNLQNDEIAKQALDAYVSNLFNYQSQLLERNEFKVLYEEIRLESKQLKAFRETFDQREKYELQKVQAEQKQKELQIQLQEVLAGKTSLMNIFNKKPKEEIIAKLQAQIEQCNKDIENIQFICDILTVLLGYIEIDRFKVEKQTVYYTMIKKIIQFEIELNQTSLDFWEKVSQNYQLL
ncbi:hypothetical protein pb186bvf_008643 [Paramecium bursaria]